MGTTLTAAYVDGHTAHWVHAGDTRLYLLRDATLRQVTRDHTFLQTFLEDGEMTPAQAAEHPLRHMLDQALGTPGCEPDTGALDLAPGDVLLLTTDGVHTELNHDRLADLLATCRDPEYAAVAIVCAVLAGEAKDNVTALVLRVD
jgi:protein phosphatase